MCRRWRSSRPMSASADRLPLRLARRWISAQRTFARTGALQTSLHLSTPSTRGHPPSANHNLRSTTASSLIHPFHSLLSTKHQSPCCTLRARATLIPILLPTTEVETLYFYTAQGDYYAMNAPDRYVVWPFTFLAPCGGMVCYKLDRSPLVGTFDFHSFGGTISLE